MSRNEQLRLTAAPTTAPGAIALAGPGGAAAPPRRTIAWIAPLTTASVLAMAYLLPAPPAAALPTPCIRTGDAQQITVTCTGDQSAGISNDDLLQSRPEGGAPTAFPRPPATPESIALTVRDLSSDITPATVSGIGLILGSTTASELTSPNQFTLVVDLGERRIEASNSAVSAIARQGAEATSITARLGGDLTTRTPSSSVVLVLNRSLVVPGVETTGNIDIAIEPESTLTAQLAGSSLIETATGRGDTTITLRARTALRGTSDTIPTINLRNAGINASTFSPSAAAGDITVEIEGGTATDAQGERIPNLRIDAVGVPGIFAEANGSAPPPNRNRGTVSITTQEGSYVLTTQNSSTGIFASTEEQDIAITVAGEVETRGGVEADPSFVPVDPILRNAVGVHAAVRRGAAQARVDVATSGEIRTRGEGADGIRLSFLSPPLTTPVTPPAEPRSRLLANVAGRITTEGADSNAILAQAERGGDAPWDVDITVEGSLRTRGTNSHGVRGIALGSDNSIRVRVLPRGSIVTGAPGSVGGRGIFLSGRPADNERTDLRIEVAGPVTSYNDNAAVWVHTATAGAQVAGDVTVVTSAPVAGHLDGTDGIDAETGNGVVAVMAGGPVETSGNGGSAILAVSRNGTNADWDVDVTVAGPLTTRGTNSHGVRGIALGSDNSIRVRVLPRGSIVTGAPGSVGGRGIFLSGRPADNERTDLRVEVAGPVTSYNDNAAVWVHTATAGTQVAGDVTVVTSAPVAGHLDGTDGIDAETGNGVVAVTAGGPVETSGNGGSAILAVSRNGTNADWDVDVTVAGPLTTRGTNSHGVRGIALGSDNSIRVRVLPRGSIVTGAPGSVGGRGIFLSGRPADNERTDLRVEVAGPVTSYNDNAAVWVHTATAGAQVAGDVTVVASAPVAGHLDGTDGIDAETGNGVVTVTVQRGGRVSTSAPAQTEAAAVRERAPLGPDQRLLLTVQGGGAVAGATAVLFDGGSDNAMNPNRILVEDGGRLMGALALGEGADFLENRGSLALLGSSQFGAGPNPLLQMDRFLQAGRLELGEPGQIATVRVADLERIDFAAESVVLLDLDGIGGQVDRLEFETETPVSLGTSVTLNGTIEIRELPRRGSFRRGVQRLVVLTTDGSLQGSGDVVLRPPATSATPVIRRSYRLEGVNRQSSVNPFPLLPLPRLGAPPPTLLTTAAREQLLLVQTTVGSFLLPGGDNAARVSEEIDRLAKLPELPRPFEDLLSVLGDLDQGDPYRTALNRLHAEPYDALLQGSWHAERALVDALWEGCAPGPDGHCAFGAVFGRFLDRAGNPLQADFEETAVGPRGGVSRQLGELAGRMLELRVGAAYEALDLEWRGGARGRGDRLLGGVALHSRGAGGASSGIGLDGLDAGLALVGGGGWFETERAVNLIDFAEAEAEPEVTFLGGHGRVLHRFGAAPRDLGWYAEIGLEGSAVALWLESFTEEADTAGPLQLRVAEARELYTSVRPQLALGGSWQWGELRVAPRARLGLNYAVGGADTPYRARFPAAPAGGGFTTRGDSENLLIEATGALDLALGERLSFQLGYAGRVSPDGTTRFHEGHLRAELRF